MRKLLLIIAAIVGITGCEMLGLDFMNSGSEDKENPDMTMPKDTVYLLQDEIDAFESVFVTKDGYCMGVQKDTTFAYVAAIDSINGQGALVIYFDEIGKVRRLYAKDHTIDLSYNDDGSVNLWYQDTDGTSEIVNDIILSSSKRSGIPTTKAGDVLDPMDFTALLALAGLTDVGKAVAMSPIIGSALKATVAADLLTSGKFSNLSTEVLTGVSSVAIAAIIGANLPLAALLAAINIANAALNDWQNAVAESYFGSAKPVTGEAVQLTDKHFVVSYSIADVDSGNTDFKVGVIVAEGKIFEDAMFITKNWHSYKKSEIYTGNNGHIIINLGDLNPKKGDKLKYRIYLEPADDNGFKWDDKLLDYWRYGAVKEFVIDEPALKIESAVQTNATTDNGYIYTFDVDVNVRNDIPFELDDWGVAIYTTSLDECTSEDQQYDIKSAKGNGSQTMSFSIDVNDVMMDTEQTPYVPIMNHFAVPYISLDGQVYGIFDNAKKISLALTPIAVEIIDIDYTSYSRKENITFNMNVIFDITPIDSDIENLYMCVHYNEVCKKMVKVESKKNIDNSYSQSVSIEFQKEEMINDYQNFIAESNVQISLRNNNIVLCTHDVNLAYNQRPDIEINDINVIYPSSSGDSSDIVFNYQVTGSYWIEQIQFDYIITDTNELGGIGCSLCQSYLKNEYYETIIQDCSYRRSSYINNVKDGKYSNTFRCKLPLKIDDERYVAIYKRGEGQHNIIVYTTDRKSINYDNIYCFDGLCFYSEFWHFEDGGCPSDPSTWPD